MTPLFEFYALLFEVFAFALVAVVCISLFIVGLYSAVEILRQSDSPLRSRRGRRRGFSLGEIG